MQSLWNRNGIRAGVVVAGVVALLALGGLTRIGAEPRSPERRPIPIPDMVGSWNADLTGYIFDNVVNPLCNGASGLALQECQPLYVHVTDEPYFTVTEQNGEAFAALTMNQNGVHHQLTGVVSPDGRVSIQSFNPGEQRFFFTGTVRQVNGVYEIDAHGHIFDDFGLSPDNIAGMMGTAHFRFVKQP